jgi:hypothetical protein
MAYYAETGCSRPLIAWLYCYARKQGLNLLYIHRPQDDDDDVDDDGCVNEGMTGPLSLEVP